MTANIFSSNEMLRIWLDVLILVMGLCIVLYPIVKKISYRILRKRRYAEIIKELDALFLSINAFQLSQAVRQDKMLESDFIYGEIDTCALLDLLDIIDPHPECVFYDLGSGVGKSSLAVKLRHPKMLVKGIELIHPLHVIAELKLKEYLDKKDLTHLEFGLHFICDNILNQNISDGDIIFINATAYSQSTWNQILYKLIHLKPGAMVIVTSKLLPTPAFTKKYQGMELMSWGLTSTYIFEKVL
jgi:hypothetical protein